MPVILGTAVAISTNSWATNPEAFLTWWIISEVAVVLITIVFYSPRWVKLFKHKHRFVTIGHHRLCRVCGLVTDAEGKIVGKLQKVDKNRALEKYKTDQLMKAEEQRAEERKREEQLLERLGIPRPLKTEKNDQETKRVSKIVQSDVIGRFADPEQKRVEAGLSFDRKDYCSTVNNLNTALELGLKELLEIPVTTSNINTANIIEIWVSNHYPCSLFLSEVRKHVLDLDNKVKHEGYIPSRKDCIDGMKSLEDLLKKLRELKLTDDMKSKLHVGLKLR
ncbi:MAG: hypothetical protein WED05_05655 [Candidatus Atabeyarchaeum deiterrae]